MYKQQRRCRESLQSIDEMNETEREGFDSMVSNFKLQNYTASDDVKKIILRDLLYKKMHFVNAEMLELLDKGLEDTEENQIYVFAQYFKHGRQ